MRRVEQKDSVRDLVWQTLDYTYSAIILYVKYILQLFSRTEPKRCLVS